MAHEQGMKWEVSEGPRKSIKFLRLWQLEPRFEKSDIALAIVSDADFREFVQDPGKLKGFLLANNVFPESEKAKPLSEIVHWASLMSASYPETNADPDQWLLTIVHGHPCRAAVTSQPFGS
jgi:hypothetical protein